MRSGAGRKASRLFMMAGGLGAGILLAPVLAGLVLAPRSGSGRPPVDDPADPGAARFLAGLDRAREGRWDEARDLFAGAEAAGVPEAGEHLAAVERRRAAEAAVARARRLLSEGDPAEAARALAEADGAPDGRALEAAVREVARRKRAELEPHLAEAGAGGEDARAELVRLSAAFPELPPAPVAAGRPNADPVARALAAFRAGRLSEARAAVAACRSPRCGSVQGGLATVEAALGPDGGTVPGGPAGTAKLEEAAAAVARLGGSPPIEKTIGAGLAPWYHDAGVEALRRGDLATARERFDRALVVLPGHLPSLQERERLRERAREAFLAGYTEKAASPDQARQKFRLVTTITAPDEELHRKARRWLAQLEGDAGVQAP